MNFENTDLLNYESIERILTSDSPNERAEIICEKIKKYCFLNNGNMYKYDTSMIVYKHIKENIPEELICLITKFLSCSKNKLTKEQTKLLSLERKNEFAKMCENSTINKMLPQLLVNLKNDDNIFQGDFYEIHYKNGYIDLKTLEFKKRIPNKHYVTNYINRDYIKTTDKQKAEFMKRIKNIYPVKEDLDAILYILGSALTGKATKEQKILFLLGGGSNGKSTLLNILGKAIQGYMDTLEEEAFSVSNTNKDKTFSTFYNRPHIRIIWTNEPKTDQMNPTTFKKFTEGEMKGKLLYKDGVHDFKHNALPVFSANFMPKIKLDGGVIRRFRGYIHTSKFVSLKNEVDESKNIYLLDRDLEDNIVKDDLLDAFIDILSEYSKKWIDGFEIPCPKSFTQSTEEMLDSNDVIQDFIDAKIKITNSNEDRIGKNQMLLMFKSLYPNKHMDVSTLNDLLKAKKLKYEKDRRSSVDGIKGCFMGIVEKNNIDLEDENKINPLDHGLEIKKEEPVINKELENKNKELEKINQNLLSQIEEMKLEIEKLKKSCVILTDGEKYNCYDEDENLNDDDLEKLLDSIINDKPQQKEEIKKEVKVKKNKSLKK